MSMITNSDGLRTPDYRDWAGHSWLDKHIAEQAAHYRLTVEQKDKLFGGAADYDELILMGEVDEPVSTRTGEPND